MHLLYMYSPLHESQQQKFVMLFSCFALRAKHENNMANSLLLVKVHQVLEMMMMTSRKTCSCSAHTRRSHLGNSLIH